MSVYSKEKPEYLDASINSMLVQTVMPDQFVLVKDGPLTQELDAICSEYMYKFKDVFTIVELSESMGLGAALNEGLKYCRNELVARMDSDDISLSTRCQEELELFEKDKNLVVVGCNTKEFYGDLSDIRTIRRVPSDYEEIKRFSKTRQPFNHPTVMYKKSFIMKLGGYLLIKRKEDFDLFSKVICSGGYVRNIDRELYLYRINEGNFLRRKSKENLLSAIHVYKLHKERGGCSMIEFLIMCGGELFFYLMPVEFVRFISDYFLRERVKKY